MQSNHLQQGGLANKTNESWNKQSKLHCPISFFVVIGGKGITLVLRHFGVNSQH